MSYHEPQFRIARACGAIALLSLGACAVNPATGGRMFSLVSEGQEIEMGQQYMAEVDAGMGLYGNSGLQAYVDSVGQALAAVSERPDLPWSFKIVDDPVINAFALPGGPVYLARGIMAYFNSEAEMASVLGHEIGHITARHSVEQISRAQLMQVGLVAGVVLVPELRPFGDALSGGLGILFLKFGRDDESQSDELGFRYMTRLGYDPQGAVDMFEILERQREAAGGSIPEWQSTHPDPGNRVVAAEQRLAESQIEGGIVRRDEYLRHIDGLLFGKDPAQGFFVEGRFVHPVLRLQFRFPEGWASQNAPTSVLAQSPDKDAVMQVTLGQGSTPEEAANAFFDQQGIERLGARSRTVNGLPAVQGTFRVTTEQGTLDGEVLFVKHGDLVFRFMGYTPTSRMGTYAVTFERSLESFAPMNEERWINLAPRRLEIVRVPDEMTAERFFERFPSTVTLETVLQINGWKTGQVIPAGSSAKRVVGEGVPGDE
ncbi:MAG: M48 family metalloprotease [Candidatus Palauibacterales bacterium]|nr:M48 family metalloprotease [Candidatus Palauibacterales bacterium]